MTGSLHKDLKVNTLVHIKVDKAMKELYSPNFLHNFIGFVWEIDEEHIYVKGPLQNDKKQSYLSGPHRYCWSDIMVEQIDLQPVIDDQKNKEAFITSNEIDFLDDFNLFLQRQGMDRQWTYMDNFYRLIIGLIRRRNNI